MLFVGYDLRLIDPDGLHVWTIRYDVERDQFVADTASWSTDAPEGR